jgi:hypothetical protein
MRLLASGDHLVSFAQKPERNDHETYQEHHGVEDLEHLADQKGAYALRRIGNVGLDTGDHSVDTRTDGRFDHLWDDPLVLQQQPGANRLQPPEGGNAGDDLLYLDDEWWNH